MSDEGSGAPAGPGLDGGRAVRAASIGVLGPMVVLAEDGEPADDRLGGPKQRLVLSLLVSDVGTVVPVGHLVEGVWGVDAGSGARSSLRVYISRLRDALDRMATIDHRHGGYVLELGRASDAMRFEQLIEEASGLIDDDPDAAMDLLLGALRLWRGPPFGDLTREPALTADVTRLERLRLRGLELLARVEIDRGAQDRVVPELRRLIGEHPLREPLWRLLMLGLYRSGRQGEALQEYERIRSTLAEELGADPSRDLQELHAAILRQDPTLDSPGRGSRAPPPRETAVSATAIVGRGPELGRVADLLRATRSGRSQIVLVAGEAGVGKSRLVREASRMARSDGVGVLVGRCMELGDAPLPFAPIGQVLRRLARDATDDQLEELLGPARNELARIVPQLGEAPTALGGGELRARLFAAVCDALVRGARRRPLLVVIEDVHWADPSTLDLLGFLARSLEGERLLLAMTFRTDELHRRHPLRSVIGELVRLPRVTRIDLDSLGRDDVAVMIGEILDDAPDPALVDNVMARSSGNPFYVEELVAAVRDGVRSGLGSGLRDVITSRLDQLPEDSRRLVEVAAVAGGSVDQQLLAAVAGEDPLVLAGRLRPTVERHVMVAEDTGFEFRHDLVREVVVADLLPGERVALHGRIATVLADKPHLASGGPDHADAELAHHWRGARQDERAVDASLRAAERARRAGAYVEALAFDEQALELWHTGGDTSRPDRIDVLEKAAETARFAGRHRRAVVLLRQALDELGDDPAREADLRSALALTLVDSAIDSRAGFIEADRALDLVSGDRHSRRRARILHVAARIRLVSGEFGDETVRLGRQAMTGARDAGDDQTELHARITVATALTASGLDEEAGFAQLRDSLRDARATGDLEAVGRALNNLVALLAFVREPDDAVVARTIDQALSWLDDELHRDHLSLHAGVRVSLARLAMRRGDVVRAEQILERLDLSRLEANDAADVLDARSELRLVQGRLDDAVEDGSAIIALGLDGHPTDWVACLEALAAVAHGDVDEVREVAARQGTVRPARAGEPVWLARLWMLRILVRAEVDAALDAQDVASRADHLDRADDALAEAGRLLTEGMSDPSPELTPAHERHANFHVHTAQGERSRAERPDTDRWRAAVAHAPSAHDRTYARWRLGESLVARGDDAGARELLQAYRDATRMGAEHLRRQIGRSATDDDLRLGDRSDVP